MEPISPELVLVDPELAKRVRALDVDVDRRARSAVPATSVFTRASEADRRPAVRPRAGPDAAEDPRRGRALKRLRRSLLAVGLLVSGFVAASAVSESDRQRPQLALPEAGETAPAVRVSSRGDGTVAKERRASVAKTTERARTRRPGSRTRMTASGKRRKHAATAAAERKMSAAVERRLLSLIVQSPAGRLPPELIDTRTGLAKNNLQAVCTRSNDSRSFLCVITSALRPSAGPVYAHYLPTKAGAGRFTWYGTR
jgi:hypothetical protein